MIGALVQTIGLPEPSTSVIVEPGSDFPLIIVSLLSIGLILGADGAVLSIGATELDELIADDALVELETALELFAVDDVALELTTIDDELTDDETKELVLTFDEAVLELVIAEEEVFEELLTVEVIAELETALELITELETTDELETAGAEKLVGIVNGVTPVGDVTDKIPDEAPVVALVGIV